MSSSRTYLKGELAPIRRVSSFEKRSTTRRCLCVDVEKVRRTGQPEEIVWFSRATQKADITTSTLGSMGFVTTQGVLKPVGVLSC